MRNHQSKNRTKSNRKGTLTPKFVALKTIDNVVGIARGSIIVWVFGWDPNTICRSLAGTNKPPDRSLLFSLENCIMCKYSFYRILFPSCFFLSWNYPTHYWPRFFASREKLPGRYGLVSVPSIPSLFHSFRYNSIAFQFRPEKTIVSHCIIFRDICIKKSNARLGLVLFDSIRFF